MKLFDLMWWFLGIGDEEKPLTRKRDIEIYTPSVIMPNNLEEQGGFDKYTGEDIGEHEDTFETDVDEFFE